MTHPAFRPLSEPQHSTIIWSAMIAGTVLWLGVAIFIRHQDPSFGGPGLDLLAWAAIALAVVGFVVSRALAGRPPAADAEKSRNRMVVQLALCDQGAIAGGMAWLFTGNPWSWLAAAIGLLGMVLVRPVRGPAQGNASSRMIR